MQNITQDQWSSAIEADANAVLLDVRTPQEYADGTQLNATCLDFLDIENFEMTIKNLDKSKNYYLFCRSGKRSANACARLDALGINTYNLLGGMLEWNGPQMKPLA